MVDRLSFAGISAIDIALWDIKGKYYNAPVHELLGGKTPVRSSEHMQASFSLAGGRMLFPREPRRIMPERQSGQWTTDTTALKSTFSPLNRDDGTYTDTDRLGLLSKEYLKMYESRLKAVREAIGPDVDIIIENHSFTDAQSSTQIGLMAKKYDIFYFEEPTTPTPQLSK